MVNQKLSEISPNVLGAGERANNPPSHGDHMAMENEAKQYVTMRACTSVCMYLFAWACMYVACACGCACACACVLYSCEFLFCACACMC